ncbi:MAG: site-specific DNA-methyltransferase, partial [Chloroflexota bacterium]|nr:site-specific DNA-methyltransferase [Chloroflexota bacterium]
MPQPNFADRTIWTGDNLEILRGLNSASVDLIYLDPPFNSNQDYSAPVGSAAAGAAFKDTWSLSDLDVAWMGLIADEQPATAQVLKTAGLTHGKGMQSYLTMMAVRLLEMQRVLKDSGSIYLHCDPTASHYLKLLMDGIFGAGNFRNEIVWKRTAGRSDGKQFGRVHDSVLFYAGRPGTWNRQYMAHDPEYVKRQYRNQDERGHRRAADITPTGPPFCGCGGTRGG